MREDVFKKYYKTMVGIINYKEKDANGNERKCTVPVSMAKQNPEKYKIFTCTHPDAKGKQFAYDPELVKKHANVLRELCRMLPQKKMGSFFDIWLADILKTKDAKEFILGETFFAMSKECRNYESFRTCQSRVSVCN